jgi:hypothetical protein
MSLFAIEKFAQIADLHKLGPAEGKDRSTVRILTTQCPSQVIAQNSFRVGLGVETRLQIGLLDQLGYCPKAPRSQGWKFLRAERQQ